MDKDFSGWLYYFTVKGTIVNGWKYKDGHIINKLSVTVSTDGRNLALNIPKPTQRNLDIMCTDWYADYYYNGMIYSTQYLGMTCTNDQNATRVPDPSGGAPPPDGSGATTVFYSTINIPGDLDALLMNKFVLTQEQIDALDLKLKEILQNCVGQALYSNFSANQTKFTILFDPNQSAQATYNPSTGSITIQDLTTMSSANLEEEFVHAFQNSFYSGGTSQYLNTASANIEFEAKLLRDMYQAMYTLPGNYAINGDPNYSLFLSDLTNGFTSYPTSLTASQLSLYKIYLSEFIQPQYNTGYTNSVIDFSFAPSAMFSTISSSACPH